MSSQKLDQFEVFDPLSHLVFDRPDEFNIERESNRHLTFGAGIHFCLGAELARTEARVAFRQLFSRIPQHRLSGELIVYKKPFGLRGPKSLFLQTN
ncbi:MAG: cytochrome P450 [Candidatus Obscuribacterales bacterium]|nr:cytochrome P450 [Candidatus Obscuribacterales bacterium]